MAEQYILPNAKSNVIRAFLKGYTGCAVTALVHENVGWNGGSRAQYKALMGLPGGAVGVNGRGGLPPHFYIEIPGGSDSSRVHTSSGDFARSLSRGELPALLKALVAGEKQWDEGRKAESLIAEVGQGNVSISIYHLDGVEVTQAERNLVAAY